VQISSDRFNVISESPVCVEWALLFDDFVAAIGELITLQIAQCGSSDRREPEVARFDRLLRAAVEKKREAKDALVFHQLTHSCRASAASQGPYISASTVT
jgi:hypothetical protein